MLENENKDLQLSIVEKWQLNNEKNRIEVFFKPVTIPEDVKKFMLGWIRHPIKKCYFKENNAKTRQQVWDLVGTLNPIVTVKTPPTPTAAEKSTIQFDDSMFKFDKIEPLNEPLNDDISGGDKLKTNNDIKTNDKINDIKIKTNDDIKIKTNDIKTNDSKIKTNDNNLKKPTPTPTPTPQQKIIKNIVTPKILKEKEKEKKLIQGKISILKVQLNRCTDKEKIQKLEEEIRRLEKQLE